MDEPSSPEGNAITLRIKFKSANVDDFVARYGADVSAGGIFIRTKQPLAVGSLLHFDFSLADGSPLMAGVGTVVWIRETDQSRVGSIPGMGVRFDQLAPESQQIHQQILAVKARRGDHPTGTPPSGSVAAPAARSPGRPATPPPIVSRPAPAPAPPVAAQPFDQRQSDVFDEFGSGGKTEIADRPPSFYFDALDGARGAPMSGPQAEEAAPMAALEDTETDSQPTSVIGSSVVSEPINISEDTSAAVPSPSAAAAQAAAAEQRRFEAPGDELAPESLELPLGRRAESGRYTDLPPLSGLGEDSAGAPSAGPPADRGWLDQAANIGGGPDAAPVEMAAEHTEETGVPPEVTEKPAGEADRPAIGDTEELGQDVPDLPVKKPGGQSKKLIVVGIVAAGLAFAGVYLLQAKPWQQTAAVPVTRPNLAVPAPTPIAPPVPPKVAEPTPPAAPPTAAKAQPVKAAEKVPAAKPTEVPAQTKQEVVEVAKPEVVAEPAKHPGPARKTAGRSASPPPGSPTAAGPAAETVYLVKVRSMPVGAQVLIDGEPMGQTPFQRRILDMDKSHAVTIRKPGYLPYERTVSPGGPWVKDGNTEIMNVAARLTRIKGQAAEPSAAPGAQPETTTDQPDKL